MPLDHLGRDLSVAAGNDHDGVLAVVGYGHHRNACGQRRIDLDRATIDAFHFKPRKAHFSVAIGTNATGHRTASADARSRDRLISSFATRVFRELVSADGFARTWQVRGACNQVGINAADNKHQALFSIFGHVFLLLTYAWRPL